VKLASLVYLLFFSIAIFPAKISAQWIDQIQTESDWEYLQRDGYFDFNSYQLYREMAEGAAVNDTNKYFASIMGNSVSDFIPYLPDKTTTADSSSDNQFPNFDRPRIFLQTGQKVEEQANSGYYLGNILWNNVAVNYKGRTQSSKWITERRAFKLTYDRYQITIGNYTADFGLGLGIGRYDYRPVTGDTSNTQSDFLYPRNSYFNGVMVKYDNNLAILLSQKNYSTLKKSFGGLVLSGTKSDFLYGITLSAAQLNSIDNHSMGAFSFFMSNERLGISGEAGYAESGAGMVLQIKKPEFYASLWHYDNHFINLQSSSTAWPDYLTYRGNVMEPGFRQAQSGETGVKIGKGVIIRTMELSGESEIWKNAPLSSVALDNHIAGRAIIGNNFTLKINYSERIGKKLTRAITQAEFGFRGNFEARLLSSIWYDGGEVNHAKSLAQVYGLIPINTTFIVSGRLRLKFDGRYDGFIEEKTYLGQNTSIKITYRWNHSSDNKIGPLYLILGSTF
jgi:hypothetical protein